LFGQYGSTKLKIAEAIAQSAKIDEQVVAELAKRMKATPEEINAAWAKREMKPKTVSYGDGSWIVKGGQDGGWNRRQDPAEQRQQRAEQGGNTGGNNGGFGFGGTATPAETTTAGTTRAETTTTSPASGQEDGNQRRVVDDPRPLPTAAISWRPIRQELGRREEGSETKKCSVCNARGSARRPGRACPATASACAATARRKTTSSSINSAPGDIRFMRRSALLALLLPSLCGCLHLTNRGARAACASVQNARTLACAVRM